MKKALLLLYVASSLWWGPAVEASFRLDRADGSDPGPGLRLGASSSDRTVIGPYERHWVVQAAPVARPVAQRAPTRLPSARPAGGDIWARLRACESSDGRSDPGGVHHGYFQFKLSTWRAVGGTGHPMDHSYEHQRALAQKLQALEGWGQWPSCSRQLGLR